MSNIKLIHGDCMDVMREYPDKYFDLAVVDPPYGIGEDGSKAKSRSVRKNGTPYIRKWKDGKQSIIKEKKYKKGNWDNSPPDYKYFKLLFEKSKRQIIWGANYYTELNQLFKTPRRKKLDEFLNNGDNSYILWDKDNGDNDFNDYEIAFDSLGYKTKIVKYRWNGMLQSDMKNKEERFHPTQKPIKLYQWILDNYATKEMKILDTHLGSASSAIAAHQFGIKEFVGVELDEDYFKAAKKRFDLITSQQLMF